MKHITLSETQARALNPEHTRRAFLKAGLAALPSMLAVSAAAAAMPSLVTTAEASTVISYPRWEGLSLSAVPSGLSSKGGSVTLTVVTQDNNAPTILASDVRIIVTKPDGTQASLAVTPCAVADHGTYVSRAWSVQYSVPANLTGAAQTYQVRGYSAKVPGAYPTCSVKVSAYPRWEGLALSIVPGNPPSTGGNVTLTVVTQDDGAPSILASDVSIIVTKPDGTQVVLPVVPCAVAYHTTYVSRAWSVQYSLSANLTGAAQTYQVRGNCAKVPGAFPTGSFSVRPYLTWSTRASMPTARWDLGVVIASNGRIYAIGGRGGNYAERLTTVEEYDPATNTWALKALMATPRQGLALAAVGAKIYVLGGGDGTVVYPAVEVYDPATNTWATKAAMPVPVYNAAAATGCNGRIYVIGGMTAAGTTGAVQEYDPVSNTWAVKASMPTSRYLLGAVRAPNSKVYAIGGLGASGYTSVVEEYDPATNTWATKAAMPTARSSSGIAGASNGKILVMGGWNGSDLSAVEQYDPSANVWASLVSLPTARHGLGAAATGDGRVFAIGGLIGGSGDSGYVSTVEMGTIGS